MRVVLVRHGAAVDRREAGTDHDRWLTVEGRRAVKTVGEMLGRLDLRYTQILTSPLVRAVQTAEILALMQPGFDGLVHVHRALSTDDGTTAQALAPLDEAPDDALIAMVTHMPKIGVLAAHLGHLANAPDFGTGAACLVDVRGAQGRLEWMLDPRSLELKRF